MPRLVFRLVPEGPFRWILSKLMYEDLRALALCNRQLRRMIPRRKSIMRKAREEYLPFRDACLAVYEAFREASNKGEVLYRAPDDLSGSIWMVKAIAKEFSREELLKALHLQPGIASMVNEWIDEWVALLFVGATDMNGEHLFSTIYYDWKRIDRVDLSAYHLYFQQLRRFGERRAWVHYAYETLIDLKYESGTDSADEKLDEDDLYHSVQRSALPSVATKVARICPCGDCDLYEDWYSGKEDDEEESDRKETCDSNSDCERSDGED